MPGMSGACPEWLRTSLVASPSPPLPLLLSNERFPWASEGSKEGLSNIIYSVVYRSV